MNFLVIDDSSTMRRIICNTIMRLGYDKNSIYEAENGQVAIDLFKEKGPGFFGIILSDINMPVKDGYEVIKEIRKLDKDIPITMITTEASKASIIKALKLGCDNYIIKPFTPQILKEKLTEILN